MNKVSAILLAAGKSERIGNSKQLLPFKDSTIIETILGAFLNSYIVETIIVIRKDDLQLKKIVKNYRVKLCLNPYKESEMKDSVSLGLKMVNKNSRGIMVSPSDLPLITTSLINRLVENFNKNPQKIIIPVYEERRGHPTIFPIKYLKNLAGLKENIGLREIIRKNSRNIEEVEIYDEAFLIDVDIYEDYLTILGRK
ncbi:MAG: nucleotidyltransferase family protein [Acidobacteriota bacterium]